MDRFIHIGFRNLHAYLFTLGFTVLPDKTHLRFLKCNVPSKVKEHSNTSDNTINELIMDKTMTNLIMFGM